MAILRSGHDGGLPRTPGVALRMLGAAFVLTACKSGDGGSGLPQVINLNGNGPVLTAPRVQPIAYTDDPELADMEAFLHQLTTTTYWAGATSQYGVGPLTVLPTINLAGAPAATTTDQTLQQTLGANIGGSSPAWGAADASTIYLFLIPPGEIISLPDAVGCTDFDGYHSQATVGSTTVAYAVGCSCPGYDGPDTTAVEERTVAVSHELVEASTDPFPYSDAAYAQEDNADIVWTVVTGGEVADMCEFNQDSNVVPPGGTFMVQRTWSNAAAAAGQNPCVPVVTSTPYFNTHAVLPDTVSVVFTNPPPTPNTVVSTPGVTIPIGTSQTIDVDLYSEAATSGPWKVTAFDYNALVNRGAARLSFSFDSDTGQNGDTLHLTITASSVDPMLGVEPFLLFSTLGEPGDAGFAQNLSMGLVSP
jgi:hypothetical protein